MADFDAHAYTPVYPGPNDDLLEAQARVCTGPHQTRPLGINPSDYPQPEPLLETLLRSLSRVNSRNRRRLQRRRWVRFLRR